MNSLLKPLMHNPNIKRSKIRNGFQNISPGSNREGIIDIKLYEKHKGQINISLKRKFKPLNRSLRKRNCSTMTAIDKFAYHDKLVQGSFNQDKLKLSVFFGRGIGVDGKL